MTDEVPTLDLGRPREDQLATMDRALRDYGFFYVSNHGINPSKQFEAAASLFRLNSEQKKSMPFDAELDIGYVGTGTQNLDPNVSSGQAAGDSKEQFMQTNNALITDPQNTILDPSNVFRGSKNFCPPDLPGYTETTLEYANDAFALNHKLNSLLFECLDIPNEDKQRLGDKPFIVLKQMKYHGVISDPSKGRFGANPHTDWGSFTILATDETPGLQILWKGDVWIPVPPRPGCLIVNSGDQIAHLTNGTYKSALHRVLTTANKERFSTAVFTYFSMDSKVGPLDAFVTKDRPALFPYRTTKEYFHAKLHASMGNTSS